MIRVWIGVAALVLCCCAQAADIVPAKVFAKKPQYVSAKISPTGKYLAVTAPVDDQTALAVIDIEAMKLISALNFSSGEHVSDYWWVSPTRVVASLATSGGTLDQLRYTGELFAMDATGSHRAYLYGYRGKAETGTKLQHVGKESGWAEMIDPLPDQPDFALISIRRYQRGEWTLPQIDRLNVHTGSRDRVGHLPGNPPFAVLADGQGQPRFAYAADEKGQMRLFASPANKVIWKMLEGIGVSGIPSLYGMDRAGSAVFLASERPDDRQCLVKYVFDAQRLEDLHCSKTGPVGSAILSIDGGHPIALAQELGRPSNVLLDATHPEAKLLQTLNQAFAGQRVQVTSATADGGRLVLLVDSDRKPGSFYLFDRATNKARFLLSRRSWIEPAAMQPAEPVQYVTRDGITIHGYLTAAGGLAARKAPLVVMPHGGPHGVRDYWKWDDWAQFLASRGYVVLQPNFRGSAGYGAGFQRAGYGKWGTLMQDDLTDGVRWAVAQGIADPERVCIFGASYGGYAALMSAVREPELYRCAAAYAGVYDLATQQEDSEIGESRYGRRYLKEVLGDDKKVWAEQSPITHLARLKAPVLIAHGTRDQRVPFAQAKLLRKALEKNGKAYEWHEYFGEEHGFYNDENHADFLNKLADFLDRHIGARRSRVTEAPGS